MSSPPLRRGVAAAGTPGSGLHILQGALLVIAVLYFGAELFIPLVLAVLLAFVLAPVTRSLRRARVPRIAAVLLAVGLALVLLIGAGTLVGRQASSLAENLPSYQSAITAKLSGLQATGGMLDRVTTTLHNVGRSLRPISRKPAETPPAAPPAQEPAADPAEATAAAAATPAEPELAPVPVVVHEPEPTPLQTLQRVTEPLLHPLATGGIVVILVIFILLYREDLRDRLIRLAGAHDLHRAMAAMDDAAYRLSRFFLAQVGLNAGFGVLIGLLLWMLGIPNPALWGFVSGLMRFVPFIGGVIAAFFPVLLAIAVDPGWMTFAIVLAVFVVGEMAMGQVFEPLIFGHSTGLSPIAVIAAATFWTWLWGPIGLLLAVPLTVCLVVLGRHVEQLEFLEVMLGDQPALDPDETFYQRALAGDLDALAEQSERFMKDEPAEAFLDAVALPALRMAQTDATRQALAPERLEQLRTTVMTLLEDLDGAEAVAPEDGAGLPPPAWQAPGAVLCLGGRGPFDAQLAAMLAEALSWRGFGVQQAPAGGAVLPAAPPRLTCLCLIEDGSSAAAARYLLRRIRRRMPGVPTLSVVWQDSGMAGNRLAEALRAEASSAQMTLATTLNDAVAQVIGIAASDAPAALPDALEPAGAAALPPPDGAAAVSA